MFSHVFKLCWARYLLACYLLARFFGARFLARHLFVARQFLACVCMCFFGAGASLGPEDMNKNTLLNIKIISQG